MGHGQPDLLRRDAEDLRHQPSDTEGGLIGSPDLDILGIGIRNRRGGVGLNQGVLKLAAAEAGFHHQIRLGKTFLHIPLFQVELVADVGALDREADAAAIVLAPVLVNQGLVFHGLLDGVYYRQRFILHIHQGGGFPGGLLGLRRHGGHGLSLVANLVQGDDGLVGDELPVGHRVVRPGDHRPNAGDRLGPLHADRLNPCVGMGTAGQGAVELAGEVHVRAIPGTPGDLFHRVLAELRASDDGLLPGGVLPQDHQAVPFLALPLELLTGPEAFLICHIVLSFYKTLLGRGRMFPSISW